MDVNDAFACLVLVLARLARRRRELAGLAARDRKDRVGDQARDQTALGQFSHHRVDQERHIVVDDLDHRDRLHLLAIRRIRRLEADFRRPACGLRKRPLRRAPQLGGVVTDKVLGRGTPEQQRNEIVRHVAFAAAQELCGRVDAGARGAVLTIGTIDDRLLVHVRFKSGESIAPPAGL
jgi:hypothetical protein